MRRSEAGKCPENPSRGHFWIVVTTKEQAAQGLIRYLCQACRKEAMEQDD